ncbi:carbohydrate porin [Thiorhodococcus minor]|uniref:Carbohydrate porin n=1 Tax=Thiorhodococcus minor TaxID=57489 RepID=A0A6M0K5R3_9GAMM|nr:carbohydrate porin [Thiorhodococcus minor]
MLSTCACENYQNKPGGNQLGVGLNWSRPNSDTFGVDRDDQWISEVFYRVQLTENLQITPNLQIVVNPALNPDRDAVALFGLRARVTSQCHGLKPSGSTPGGIRA